MRSILTLVLILVSTATHAYLLENGFSVDYDVSKNNFSIGVSKRKLVSDGEKLEYTSTTVPEGLAALLVKDRIVERSILSYHNNKIRPSSYSYEQTGGKKEKRYQIDFNWDKQQLTSTLQKGHKPLLDGTQDLLSLQLAMMHDLQQGNKSFSYIIAERDKLKSYQLTILGTETLETPLGKMETIKVEHYDTQKKDRFTFWCAKSLEYLPIKIRKVEEDGDVVLLQLRAFNKR